MTPLTSINSNFNVFRLPHFARFGIYGSAVFFYFPFIGIAVLSTVIGLVLFRRRSQRIRGVMFKEIDLLLVVLKLKQICY